MLNQRWQLKIPPALQDIVIEDDHQALGACFAFLTFMIICFFIVSGELTNPVAISQWLLLPPCLYVLGIYIPLGIIVQAGLIIATHCIFVFFG